MYKYVKKQLSRKAKKNPNCFFSLSWNKDGKKGDPGCLGTGGGKKSQEKGSGA